MDGVWVGGGSEGGDEGAEEVGRGWGGIPWVVSVCWRGKWGRKGGRPTLDVEVRGPVAFDVRGEASAAAVQGGSVARGGADGGGVEVVEFGGEGGKEGGGGRGGVLVFL